MNPEEVSTIPEAVNFIVNKIEEDGKKDFVKNYSDVSDFTVSVHNLLGRVIRNKFNLWDENSDLHNAIKDKTNLVHADDQSAYLLRLLWSEITDNKIDMDSWLWKIDDYWNEMSLPEYAPKT